MPAFGFHRTRFKKPPQIAVGTALRLPADWDLLVIAPVNVLVIGESATTSAVVDAMRPHLVEPLVTVGGHDPLNLPSVGTVILSDVEGLVLADQQRLNTWLTDHRSRLITTSRVSLLPMIAAGMFVESLYYRLNTLFIDLTGDLVER
jgi:hypothetical protein